MSDRPDQKHHERAHHGHAGHDVGHEAHKIESALKHHDLGKVRHELQHEAHTHPKEFEQVLHKINADRQKNHESPLSVEHSKDGQVSSIHFGKDNIYESKSQERELKAQAADRALPEPVRRAIAHERRASHGRHGHPHASRFVQPSEAGPDSTGPQGDQPPGQDNPGPGGGPQASDRLPTGDGTMNANTKLPSENGFGQQLLTKLGLPVTEKNLAFLNAWQKAEGGSADNPFNTTQGAPGARSINRAGVKRYDSMEAGLNATVKTLTNGLYNGILDALKNEDVKTARAKLMRSSWGTHQMPQIREA